MEKITSDNLQQAAAYTSTLPILEKSVVMDKIKSSQPVLFDSIAIQRELGHDPDNIQILFDMLLVISIALDQANLQIPTVTQGEYLTELSKFSKQMSFSAGLEPEQHAESQRQYRNHHSELTLLTWAQKVMTDAGFTDMGAAESKQLMLAGITLVNCVAQVLAKE